MKFRGLLSLLRNVKFAHVITHRLADADAFCSAYAIADLLMARGIEAQVIFPEGLNTLAEKIQSKFPIIERTLPLSNTDLIIIVDTNSLSMISDLSNEVCNSKARKLIIDHHPLTDSIDAIKIIDTRATSTCEIICNLLRKSRVKTGKDVAQVLLLGIIADSQHLLLANEDTIDAVNYLCKHGASLSDTKSLLSRERDYAEKIARLKATQRSVIYRLNDTEIIMAFSRIGSYHASAAKALSDIGADLAIVIGSDTDGARASMRATQSFYSKTKLHLGVDIASKISKSGGGHATAASLSIDIDEDELEKRLIKIIKESLKADLLQIK